MRKFFHEFKTFISRGNVIDLAVAVIIGAAFGKITTSLVNDVVMPIISLALGGLSVVDWKWVITPAQVDANGVVIVSENALRYGQFIQSIIDFLIIAFIIFLMLKAFNSLNKGISNISDQYQPLTKQEVRDLRKQGKKWKEIQAIAEQAKADKELAEQEQAKNAPPVETSETLLKEIRDLLKLQNKG